MDLRAFVEPVVVPSHHHGSHVNLAHHHNDHESDDHDDDDVDDVPAVSESHADQDHVNELTQQVRHTHPPDRTPLAAVMHVTSHYVIIILFP